MTKKARKTNRVPTKMIFARIVALLFALLMLVAFVVAFLPGCAPKIAPEPSSTPSQTAEPTELITPTPLPPVTATPSLESIPAAASAEFVEPLQKGLIPLPIPDEARLTALIQALSIPRPMGTLEEKMTADFIQKQLEILGYTVKLQELNEKNTHFAREAQRVSLTVDVTPITDISAVKGTGNGDGKASIIYYDEKTSLPSNIDGKILLMPDSQQMFNMLLLINKEQKPAAVLVYYIDQPAASSDNFVPDGQFPVIKVTSSFAKSVKDQLDAGKAVEASYYTAFAVNTFESYNIEASLLPETNATDAPLYILCAHYDSVYSSYGANDNASGVASLLETARLMKNVSPDAEMRFLFFTGEEDGMVGSKYYVENLPDSDKKRLSGVVNLDMFGSINGKLPKIYTVSGEPNAVAERFYAAFVKYFPTHTPPILEKEDRSDHVYFQKAGFPAIMFGQDEVVGEYHSLQDVPSIISVDNLKAVVTYVMAFIACEQVAN